MWNFLGNASQPMLGLLSAAFNPIKPGAQPVILPKGVPSIPATPVAKLEAAIKALHSKKKEWANLGCAERASLLRECIDTTVQASEGAARLLAQAKGSYGNGLGEERTLLITPVYALREYAQSLESNGQPNPRKLYQRSNGQHVAEVLPTGIEAMFFGGFRGEVWMQPGKPPSQLSKDRVTQGRVYRDLAAGKVQDGSVSLVLGAGNQVSVVIMDVLHMLVTDNSVVICKFNPVQDYLGPFVEEALAPLAEKGYVIFAYGGAEEGQFLCRHPQIDKIHLTGSAATYDAVVWGGKPKTGPVPLKKQITAELGCVTPYIVVPGNWSRHALEYHADECVAGLVTSSGHNCTKLEVLVTAEDWPQREEFVAAVRRRLAEIPRRVAWYPGSEKRHAAFKAKFKDAQELGTKVDDRNAPAAYLPWLFKSGLSPDEADTQTETWCGVLQEVAIPGTGTDAPKFLASAVDFANDRCWGSLSCSVIAPPETDAAVLDSAVAKLRYGTICINLPSFVGYSFPQLSWGAFPGNTPQDIGSGVGCVHNTLLFDHVQKSVIYSAWIQHPTHLWSTRVRNLEATAYHALRFLAYPGLITLTATAINALKG